MSTDPNPYAPPGVAEPEVQSTRYWYVQGTDLLAKNGATLPKVDLDTGVHEGPMTAFPRVVKVTNPADILKGLALLGAVFFLRDYFHLEKFGLFLPFFILLLLLKRIGVLRESTNSVVRVWSFIETPRAKRSILRRRLRIGAMILMFMTIMCPPFLDGALPDFLAIWFQWILPAGILTMLGLAIWAIFDRPKTKTKVDSPGWLRFSGIDPQALAHLRADEEAYHLQHAALATYRKRLVRTVFYHRYPLRMLIGHRIYNPFAILQLFLMKFLRSKLLVRQAYHFSEAEEVSLGNLCPPLREAAESWLAARPDWIFITGERLPSPAGDLVVECADIASPGLEHCLRITRAWMEQKPEKGITQFTFMTWHADGSHSSTVDQPYLALRNPQLHHRASGPPERVFQAHLRHLSGHTISPAASIPELHARLLDEKEETDRLLTEHHLQDETREAS